MTVLSSAPMNKDEIYDLFLAVLQVHGFTAIPGEEVIKVVQQVDAKQSAESLTCSVVSSPSTPASDGMAAQRALEEQVEASGARAVPACPQGRGGAAAEREQEARSIRQRCVYC